MKQHGKSKLARRLPHQRLRTFVLRVELRGIAAYVGPHPEIHLRRTSRPLKWDNTEKCTGLGGSRHPAQPQACAGVMCAIGKITRRIIRDSDMTP